MSPLAEMKTCINSVAPIPSTMAMPVRSMLKHFRSEFAEVMERARFSADELAHSHAGLVG